MNKTFATVSLIVLNLIAFVMGIWAAFGSMWYTVAGVKLLPTLLFIAVLPSPLALVWRSFRDNYGFSKAKFYLCTALPPFIALIGVGAWLMVLVNTVGSQNGGWGGLALLAMIFAISGGVVGLVVSTTVWTTVSEVWGNILGDRAKKAIAIIMLIICGTIICGGLRGLVESPIISIVHFRPNERSFIVFYACNVLADAVIPAIPLGFGAAALMRVYSKEYSLKAPLFLLCAFLPTLLISGGSMLKQYLKDNEKIFYHHEFTVPLDMAIITLLIAVIAAVVYAVGAIIRSRRHYY